MCDMYSAEIVDKVKTEAYQQGLIDGDRVAKEALADSYKQGLNAAWDAVRTLFEIDYDKRFKLFGADYDVSYLVKDLVNKFDPEFVISQINSESSIDSSECFECIYSGDVLICRACKANNRFTSYDTACEWYRVDELTEEQLTELRDAERVRVLEDGINPLVEV